MLMKQCRIGSLMFALAVVAMGVSQANADQFKVNVRNPSGSLITPDLVSLSVDTSAPTTVANPTDTTTGTFTPFTINGTMLPAPKTLKFTFTRGSNVVVVTGYSATVSGTAVVQTIDVVVPASKAVPEMSVFCGIPVAVSCGPPILFGCPHSPWVVIDAGPYSCPPAPCHAPWASVPRCGAFRCR